MKIRTLVVDDSGFAITLMVRALNKNHCDVVGLARNGFEAIEQYRKLKPDLVTMDLKMPEMDGITALKSIIVFDRQAKIIMVTSIGDKANVLECIKAGAVNYILKPFTPEKVGSVLRQCFPEHFLEEDESGRK